jgi:hypothetical protein
MLNIISQPNSFVLGRNPINYKVGSSSYLAHIADFKILAYVQIYNYVTGTYSTIATLTGLPNIKNKVTISSTDYYFCTFDVKNVIMTYLSKLGPDYDFVKFYYVTQFKVIFEEYYDGAASGTTSTGNITQAAPAGRSFIWQKSADIIAKAILQDAGINRIFLTNKRKIINHYYKAPLFLAFNNYDFTVAGDRKVKCVFTHNGTNYPAELLSFGEPDTEGNFYRFVVDLGEINFVDDIFISDFDINKLTSFTIQITSDTGAAFTEAITVIMRNSFPYPMRHFYYRNDHGTIDYLPIFGKRTVNNDLTMQSAILNADNSATLGTYGILNAEKINYNELLKEEIEQATGYTSETEFDLFTEFMLSDARWEMIRRDGRLVWVPIQLVEGKFMGKADRQSTWGQKFKFTYGIEEEFCR